METMRLPIASMKVLRIHWGPAFSVGLMAMKISSSPRVHCGWKTREVFQESRTLALEKRRTLSTISAPHTHTTLIGNLRVAQWLLCCAYLVSTGAMRAT